jgi:hypothetical protein
VALPIVFAGVLLVSVGSDASGVDHGWLIIVACFVAGAIAPIVYTLGLARRDRLLLRDEDEIACQRKRLVWLRPVGWALSAGLVLAILALHGAWHIAALALLAGLIFGFWPGLLANFVRLRRERRI